MGDDVEPFKERFRKLTAGVADSDLMKVLDMSIWGVNKLRSGDTVSLKLDAALRLSKFLNVSPWEFASDPDLVRNARLDGTKPPADHREWLIEQVEKVPGLEKDTLLLLEIVRDLVGRGQVTIDAELLKRLAS